MLFIKKVESLKITKIKLWAVYFEVDGKTYLLHESADCYESNIALYEKINDVNGRYELKHISGDYGSLPSVFMLKNGETYLSMNKYKIVLELIKRKLVITNDNAIKLLMHQNKKINELYNMIREVEIKVRVMR